MNFTEQYFANAQNIIMDVLHKVRPELMAAYGKVAEELKADKSVVTALDKSLEIKLKDALRKFDSAIGFWGEEHGREGNENSFWLIDPIDGTEHFIRGTTGRNILTFIDGGEPLFALVYRFPTDDLFIAQKGQPTLKNGQPVKLSARPLSRAWLEFSVNMREADGYEIYKNLRPKIAGITVHRDFLEILEGGLEGYVVYKSGGQEWDYAPRALLIEGAGGRVTNVGSDSYDYRDKSLIATTPLIYDQVKRLVEEALT